MSRCKDKLFFATLLFQTAAFMNNICAHSSCAEQQRNEEQECFFQQEEAMALTAFPRIHLPCHAELYKLVDYTKPWATLMQLGAPFPIIMQMPQKDVEDEDGIKDLIGDLFYLHVDTSGSNNIDNPTRYCLVHSCCMRDPIPIFLSSESMMTPNCVITFIDYHSFVVGLQKIHKPQSDPVCVDIFYVVNPKDKKCFSQWGVGDRVMFGYCTDKREFSHILINLSLVGNNSIQQDVSALPPAISEKTLENENTDIQQMKHDKDFFSDNDVSLTNIRASQQCTQSAIAKIDEFSLKVYLENGTTWKCFIEDEKTISHWLNDGLTRIKVDDRKWGWFFPFVKGQPKYYLSYFHLDGRSIETIPVQMVDTLNSTFTISRINKGGVIIQDSGGATFVIRFLKDLACLNHWHIGSQIVLGSDLNENSGKIFVINGSYPELAVPAEILQVKSFSEEIDFSNCPPFVQELMFESIIE